MAGNKPTAKIKNHKDDRIKSKKVLVSNQGISDGNSTGSPPKSADDLSVLRKSVPTSIVGFRQIRKLYDTATEEVQSLLTNECDFIYECRVCRNIFRSLANFLSHKRIYCKQKFNKSLHAHFMSSSFLNEDTTEIYCNDISEEKQNSKISTSSSSNKKDLTSIIDKLGQKNVDKKFGIMDYYNEVNYHVAQKDALRSEHAIRLDDIENNKSAVFQTIVKEEDCDTKNEFILDEIIELHDMLWKENAVMGPDGRLLAVDAHGQIKEPRIVNSKNVDEEDDIAKCEICTLEFQTRKMLLYHIKIKHSTSHMHYPCPSCSDIFATAGAVYRHLCKVHNNTMVTIRKLRDQILSKGFTLGNASKKMLERVNKQNEDAVMKFDQQDENDSWMLDFELDLDTLRCNGCGRKFERRAALTSHQLICRNRMQTHNRFLTSSVKKIVEEADHEEGARNSRKSKAPLKKIKNNKDASSAAVESTMQTETTNDIEFLSLESDVKDDSTENCDNVTSDQMLPNNNLNNNEDEINSRPSNEKCNDVKINRRKRPHTTRIVNEELECSDDLYWEMNEDGCLSVKRPKEDSHDDNENITEDLKKKMLSLINEKKLQCIPCKKIFPSLTNLKRHIALHMKWKRFQCGLCASQFYHRSECVYHLGRTHNMMGDKNFVDNLIIPIKNQDSEIHVYDLPTSTDEDATRNSDTESGKEVSELKKNSIDLAIDDVIMKYTEHSSEPDESKDPLSNDDTATSAQTESSNNSDHRDQIGEQLNDESKPKIVPEIIPVRKRGRPRSVFTERSVNDDEDSREKRGRGRPKGSLNKDKRKKSGTSKTRSSVDSVKQESDQPPDNDKMRKMVLEVIFGGEKKEDKECDAETKSENPPSPDTDVSCASTDYEIKTKYSDSADATADGKACRPIRNRVKVVNKDFVYDLSDLLKKEAEAYKESQCTTYSRFKKRANSVTHGDSSSNKDCEERNDQSLSVSPTNSMQWENNETYRLENSERGVHVNTSADKTSEDEINSDNKSLCLFELEHLDMSRIKDPLSEMEATEFKIEPGDTYKSNDSLEDITVIPVNISSNSADDSSSSSDEMPLLEINMSQDVDSNDEEVNYDLADNNMISSDPESSCPDIAGENYNKQVTPVECNNTNPSLVNSNRSVLKPQQIQNNTENANRLNRVYIRKPSGDLQEIIFEVPVAIDNNKDSSHTSLMYESHENSVLHNSEFRLKNNETESDTNTALRIESGSLPLGSNSIIEDSSSESNLSDDDY